VSPLLFWFLAGVVLIPAVAVVVSQNLFHAGISLVVSFLGIAALYVTLSAPFVAGMQVLVYAGAIAVLLLFAFMLTHDIMKPMEGSTPVQRFSSLAACVLLAGAMARVLISSGWELLQGDSGQGVSLSSVGEQLLSHFLVPFELISILLLITLIGAVVIARKEERDLPAPALDEPQVALPAPGEQA
jgi:NADH-quinone oxidoreductase subunit J